VVERILEDMNLGVRWLLLLEKELNENMGKSLHSGSPISVSVLSSVEMASSAVEMTGG